MTYLSPEEQHARQIEQFGEDLGSKLYWLDNAVINLHREWLLFRELFAAAPQRVEVMNEASKTASFWIAKALYQSVVLGICRITDAAESKMRGSTTQNLSLRQLETSLPSEMQVAFGQLCETAKQKAEGARLVRNKIIAHADLSVATTEELKAQVSCEDIEAALTAIRNTMNFVHETLGETTVVYDKISGSSKHHSAFLRSLYLGNRQWNNHLADKKKAVEAHDHYKLRSLEERLDIPSWIYS